MQTSDFDYVLPPARIAQSPADRRDASRLLVLDRSKDHVEHTTFDQVGRYLRPGDVLVLNNTRVIPARLHGTKQSTGGRVELFLLEDEGDGYWDALLKAGGRRPRPGEPLLFAGGRLRAELVEEREMGRARVRLQSEQPVLELLDAAGETPLPPYIQPGDAQQDRARYQTVYARNPGAVAAPTAGLHFTPALLDSLRANGIETAEITLHVGIGTFRPVTVENPDEHRMDAERFEVKEDAAARIECMRRSGGRVIAVGSTSVRTLETVTGEDGHILPGSGRSDLFIRPGYRFKTVDAMITNFHLPRSTLLMMVCALAGRERIQAAYREAIDREYRFFSYGDAMLIL